MHKSVLLQEVIEIFNPQPGQKYIDATINGGGHAKAILERIRPEGKLLGIDLDCDLISELKEEKNESLQLACGNFADIVKISKEYNFEKVNGILLDLGFSSYHIEKSGRGFSFMRDEPLDMRYRTAVSGNGSKIKTALEILNNEDEREIGRILREYGEERFAARIAKVIVEQRKIKPITSTFQLVEVVERSTPRWYHRRSIHPATKTFQALRIAVNRELKNLEKALEDSINILAGHGKIIVISFHSLEDRLVKNFFKEKEKEQKLKILAKKPIRPTPLEIKINPRSRRAKLRTALKII